MFITTVLCGLCCTCPGPRALIKRSQCAPQAKIPCALIGASLMIWPGAQAKAGRIIRRRETSR